MLHDYTTIDTQRYEDLKHLVKLFDKYPSVQIQSILVVNSSPQIFLSHIFFKDLKALFQFKLFLW